MDVPLLDEKLDASAATQIEPGKSEHGPGNF
jgi:hypothetical protein